MNTMKPFRCLKCGITFGMTDGEALYCGEFAKFTLKVTPTCLKCGEHRTWRPIIKVVEPVIEMVDTGICPTINIE